MIEEMIDSILAAEDKAKEIVRDSVNASNDIVSEAKKQAAAIYDGAKDAQYAKEREYTAKGEADGEAARIARIDETRAQIEKMRDIPAKKKEQVYTAIMKELKAKYGVK